MISLSSEEANFLINTLELPKHLKEKLAVRADQQGIEISADTADELRDHCLERYDTHGLDEGYVPTSEGRKLDTLIDKLFTG